VKRCVLHEILECVRDFIRDFHRTGARGAPLISCEVLTVKRCVLHEILECVRDFIRDFHRTGARGAPLISCEVLTVHTQLRHSVCDFFNECKIQCKNFY
jgi:hypothetical protein